MRCARQLKRRIRIAGRKTKRAARQRFRSGCFRRSDDRRFASGVSRGGIGPHRANDAWGARCIGVGGRIECVGAPSPVARGAETAGGLVDRGRGSGQSLIVDFTMALSGPSGAGCRRPAVSEVLEAEIDVLLEFFELIVETVDVELHLFDLPVERPQLVLEPIDADIEVGGILTGARIAAVATDGNIGRRPIV